MILYWYNNNHGPKKGEWGGKVQYRDYGDDDDDDDVVDACLSTCIIKGC